MKKGDLLFNVTSIMFSIGAGLGLGLGLGLTLNKSVPTSIESSGERASGDNRTSQKNVTILTVGDSEGKISINHTMQNTPLEPAANTSIVVNVNNNTTIITTNQPTATATVPNTIAPVIQQSTNPSFPPSLSSSLSPSSSPPSNAPTFFPFSLISSPPSSISPERPVTIEPTRLIIEKTEAPTTAFLTMGELEHILGSVSSASKLQEESSPQYRASHWIMESTFKPDIDQENNHYSLIQRYVLAVLYFTTGGEDWVHSYDFLSNQHVCNWKGAREGIISGVQECDDNLYITKLSLESVLMEGTLPEEIGHLTSLKSLNFHENNLEGAVPESFANLTLLEVVRLQSNFISGNISPICEALKENIKVFHVDRDQISCDCCSCCPFDRT